MLAIKQFILKTLSQIVTLESEVILFATLLAITIIVVDSFSLMARKKRQAAGIEPKAQAISIDGGKSLPVREYVSEIQGLAGKPDALTQENGFIIPVERKPLARKLRDRYVAQLLVYMRLVEEFEGKKPPYGYLILGSNCRRFKIANTDERQAWLQKMLDEMQETLAGAPARATPHHKKCLKCDVSDRCAFKIDHPNERRASKRSSLSIIGDDAAA
ncbi:MAG: Dna2/Cas4 domain-containing protein [Bdellovibrionales bacterium]|nr:Dna2/Cas4 domain-containing protein [Bdellovibrionales bacterium]